MYAAAKSTQEEIEEFNRKEEAKMPKAQEERNVREDRLAKEKAARQRKADIGQVISLREQQAIQSAQRQDERDFDVEIANVARAQDQQAAMAAMRKEIRKRQANMQHRAMIER